MPTDADFTFVFGGTNDYGHGDAKMGTFGDGSKDEKGEPLSKYIQAEKEVLDFYGVEYLDLSYLFPTPKTNTGDTLTADGLHPNDYGHKLLAQRLIEYLECRLYKNKK